MRALANSRMNAISVPHLLAASRPCTQGGHEHEPAASTPRSLAGATILQLVPALRDDPAGHAAVDIALTLLQSGARAIVAGEGGPLVGELRAFGGEWLPMTERHLQSAAHPRQCAHGSPT